MNQTQFKQIINTPIGDMLAIANNNAIISLDFCDDKEVLKNSNHPLLITLQIQLQEYFLGKRKKFTLNLEPKGSEFSVKVWHILSTIEYGTTISYAQEAMLLGNKNMTRAVANANGRNPINILIPCHRVITSSGKIGGYTGGVDKKEFLLNLEKTTNIKISKLNY